MSMDNSVKSRLFLNYLYAKQHADFMFGMQVGLDDISCLVSLRQKIVATPSYTENFACVVINFFNMLKYVFTWGVMFIMFLIFAPSWNIVMMSDAAAPDDDAVVREFIEDAIRANHQGALDRFAIAMILIAFAIVSLCIAVFLLVVEFILAVFGQELYFND